MDFDPISDSETYFLPEPGSPPRRPDPAPPEDIYVTRPTLPPMAALQPLLDEMWDTRMLTNRGAILRRFELALSEHLGVPHVSLVANATLGCMIAMRHLGVTGRGAGEVITTPFSFVATTHAIAWAGAEPVFADIDPVTLNLDPAQVERAITPRTRAILAVHCYANPCDVSGLGAVAARHGIPLIYDAAHCFGATLDGRSLLDFGDLSVMSLHATKVFHSVEGGAIISHDAQTKQALDRLANYGIVDNHTIDTLGLNAKMSELHAAVGLAGLPGAPKDIVARGAVVRRYWAALGQVKGLRCVCPPDRPGQNNYAFPILVEPGYPVDCETLADRLASQGIYARRYFHPLVSDLPMYRSLPSARQGLLPHASAAARQVLCLPVFPELAPADQDRIVELILTP